MPDGGEARATPLSRGLGRVAVGFESLQEAPGAVQLTEPIETAGLSAFSTLLELEISWLWRPAYQGRFFLASACCVRSLANSNSRLCSAISVPIVWRS